MHQKAVGLCYLGNDEATGGGREPFRRSVSRAGGCELHGETAGGAAGQHRKEAAAVTAGPDSPRAWGG